MHQTGLAEDPGVREHDTGPGHPERQERCSAILKRFEASGLIHDLTLIRSRLANDEELGLVHTPSYIALVQREVAEGRAVLSTGDTDISWGSMSAARIAAGLVLSAVDAVYGGEVRNAFCVARPPGHHAGANRGMGFCLFNNIAIGARYAQKAFGAKRVLIADWDVHHGNGTQDIFYEDGSVLFFSTHQSPWYPGTGSRSERGEGAGLGTTINCPFPAGSGRTEIVGAFREELLPAAKEFRPDLVMISAGFDSRINDPLGGFRLTDDDFSELTNIMTDLAAEQCAGRLVSVLEGGYNLDGLARASEAHVRALYEAV
jgi:acetoin utilization deacetylase AcuC-like enzyme